MLTFVQRLNTWSAQGIPFLFVIDFELNKPFACKLEDATRENIFFDLHGYTNIPTGKIPCDDVLEKWPEPFAVYRDRFDQVQKALEHGNSFLTNLTIRTKIRTTQSLTELFSTAKAKYKLLFKDRFLVFSPETFVKIVGNEIVAMPMKGTMDAATPGAEEALRNSIKESAEHVTIVDLLRNDLSQVATNVRVTRFKYLEKITTNQKDLWQMSSQIAGDLPADYRGRLGDILWSLLPAGSVSGAPKQKTMEIIRQAEQQPRGYYTGVFGYFDGENLDSAVLIRFIEKVGDELFYRSGGGITTQSTAQEEYQEAIDKIYVPVD